MRTTVALAAIPPRAQRPDKATEYLQLCQQVLAIITTIAKRLGAYHWLVSRLSFLVTRIELLAMLVDRSSIGLPNVELASNRMDISQ